MNLRAASKARRAHLWVSTLLFDPLDLARRYRAVPHFLRNWRKYSRQNTGESFEISLSDLWYRTQDRYDVAGTAIGHYFFQDLWAATLLHNWGVRAHVDVGSRLDGFVAHLLPFASVTYVDIRPLDLSWPGFTFRQGSVTDIPFETDSVQSLSCLHVIEHIGLGRYGDPIDPRGHLAGAKELSRVLAPDSKLLVGTPVGRERLCFDAHRVFDPSTVIGAFDSLRLEEFLLIDDVGKQISTDPEFELARRCEYGCGLFVFRKAAAVTTSLSS